MLLKQARIWCYAEPVQGTRKTKNLSTPIHAVVQLLKVQPDQTHLAKMFSPLSVQLDHKTKTQIQYTIWSCFKCYLTNFTLSTMNHRRLPTSHGKSSTSIRHSGTRRWLRNLSRSGPMSYKNERFAFLIMELQDPYSITKGKQGRGTHATHPQIPVYNTNAFIQVSVLWLMGMLQVG